VTLIGRPEVAALIGVIVLGLLGEEDGAQFVSEVVPAIGTEHGTIHLVVQIAQGLNGISAVVRIMETIVCLGHALARRNHQLGTVIMVGLTRGFESIVGLVVGWKGEGL